MWNACGKALSAIAAVLIGTAVSAQTYPNKLNADSVDPASDAAYIREMQQRMDRIHRTEHRPTVALVLSGGGAKGSAHVGVLRKLEEMQIPIDLICGTSMGGLVGGLYAMGYPASYLDTLLRSQDWGFTLTDKVDQKYIPYSSKEYKSRYLISIPFHYDKKDVSEDREARLLLDADSEELTTRTGVNTLASSLPSGYVYGFNVNNLISSLTVGYQDSISFASLPIPYYSVAADIVSCKAKNWGSGSVKEAMRSTMSIPGMFDPVRTDGMVLVDGGVRNNFPVDLARAMGADYVIGVELSGSAPDFDQVKNLGNILMQFIKMLGKDAFDKNTPNVDVFIKPDLDGFNMLSFSDVAIDTMINRGYNAACAHNDELQVIKDHMKDAVPRLNNRKATDLSESTVLVSSISFNGLTDDESKILMEKIGLRVGTYLNKKDMDSAMSKLQATGSFESVTYSLLGSGEPYRLEFDCVKAPTHKVGVGFRVDSHEWASILLNLGLNTNKLQGSRLDIEGRIGLHRYIGAAYSLDLPRVPTFNAEVRYTSTYGDILGNTGIPNYNISVNSHKELLYISNIKGTKSDLRIGIQNYWFKTRTLMADEQNIMALEDMDGYTSGDFLSAFADAKLYTLDDRYFPTRGYTFKGKAEWVFARSGSCPEESRRIPVIALDYMQAIPLGRSVSFISDLHVRNIFEQHNALCFANIAGGSIYGHYLDHQIPFVGFHQTYIGYNHMAVANLELRVNPVGNFYISALGGALQQGTTFKEEFTSTDKMIIGAGLRASYDSLFGPVRADVSWSSLTKKAGFFISAGFDF